MILHLLVCACEVGGLALQLLDGRCRLGLILSVILRTECRMLLSGNINLQQVLFLTLKQMFAPGSEARGRVMFVVM